MHSNCHTVVTVVSQIKPGVRYWEYDGRIGSEPLRPPSLLPPLTSFRAVELLLNALERLGLSLETVRKFLLGEEQTPEEEKSREAKDNDAPVTPLEGTTREIRCTMENSKPPV